MESVFLKEKNIWNMLILNIGLESKPDEINGETYFTSAQNPSRITTLHYISREEENLQLNLL